MSHAAVKQRSNSEYSKLLEKLDSIPTLPSVAVRVNELINDPHSSSSDIAALLKKDQVLTAKILKLANSSYYSIPGGVSDVQRALAFLGFNTLAQLVLGISVISLFQKIEAEDFSMLDFWKHALATAIGSEILAKRLKYPKPEEAFTCGLLHDIGKLVLHEIDPARLKSVVATAREKNTGFYEVETEMDLPGHCYLGEVIATKWGLPQIIRQAIHFHHQDVSKIDTILPSVKPVIQIVRLANAIAVKNKMGKSGDYTQGAITSDMTAPLQISPADIQQIENQIKTGMDKAGVFLSVYR